MRFLMNKGDGRFEDGSAAFGLDRATGSIGVAAADFDADRHIDLFLTGPGGNRLLRNHDDKTFEDISQDLKPAGLPAVSLLARWLDLDQDGDLDLYVVNYCGAEHAEKAFAGEGEPPPGVPNSVFRNDGEPAADSANTIHGRAPVATAYEPRPATRVCRSRSNRGRAQRRCWAEQERTPASRCSTSTTIAISTWCLRPTKARRWPCSMTGWASSTRRRSQVITPPDGSVGASDHASRHGRSRGRGCGELERPGAGVAQHNRARPWPTRRRSALNRGRSTRSRWRSAQAVDLDLDGRTDLLGMPAESTRGAGHALAVLGPTTKGSGSRFRLWQSEPSITGFRQWRPSIWLVTPCPTCSYSGRAKARCSRGIPEMAATGWHSKWAATGE